MIVVGSLFIALFLFVFFYYGMSHVSLKFTMAVVAIFLGLIYFLIIMRRFSFEQQLKFFVLLINLCFFIGIGLMDTYFPKNRAMIGFLLFDVALILSGYILARITKLKTENEHTDQSS